MCSIRMFFCTHTRTPSTTAQRKRSKGVTAELVLARLPPPPHLLSMSGEKLRHQLMYNTRTYAFFLLHTKSVDNNTTTQPTFHVPKALPRSFFSFASPRPLSSFCSFALLYFCELAPLYCCEFAALYFCWWGGLLYPMPLQQFVLQRVGRPANDQRVQRGSKVHVQQLTGRQCSAQKGRDRIPECGWYWQ